MKHLEELRGLSETVRRDLVEHVTPVRGSFLQIHGHFADRMALQGVQELEKTEPLH